MELNYILRRNIIYFFISFFSAGSVNIIPQLFYDSNYPAQKGLYLSITLIVTSLAAVLGVYSAGKLLNKANSAIIPVYLLFVAGFCFNILAHNLVVFIITLAVTAFFCNYLFNYSDGLFLSRTPHSSFDQHIKTILIYQLSGYMLSPIFFAVSGQNKILNLSCILMLALFSVYSLTVLYKPVIKEEIDEKMEVANLIRGKLNFREGLFTLYSLCVMMAEMIALSFMVYFLSDYYELENYIVKSGIAMLEIVMLSGISVALMDIRVKVNEDKIIKDYEYLMFSPLIQLSSVALFMVSIILLALKLNNSFGYIMLSLVPVGPAYGCFLKKSRSYASNMSIRNKKTVLISMYNNIQNISGLIGYFIVMLCYLAAEWFNLQYLKLAIGTIIFMLMVAAAFIALWVLSYKRETKIS